MKISSPARLLREALTDAPAGEYVDRILEKINSDAEMTNQALMQNLTIADNMNAAIVNYKLTHATEIKIPNPLKTRPVGIYAVRSSAINGGTRYSVASLDWRFVDSGDPKDKQQIGITATYDSPLGYCRASSTAAVSIPHNAATAVTMNAADQSGNASWVVGSPTKITCAVSGRVSVGMSGLFDTAAGGWREGYILKNNTGTVLAYDLTPGGTYAAVNASDEVDVVAGDYFVFKVLQNQTAVAALNMTADTISMRVRYIAPPSSAQNNVSLLVIGG